MQTANSKQLAFKHIPGDKHSWHDTTVKTREWSHFALVDTWAIQISACFSVNGTAKHGKAPPPPATIPGQANVVSGSLLNPQNIPAATTYG